ncbi:hypothetical protein HRbin04_00313 [archaeon HR04]|nr:hypothetical protein HRbin04_00313 [archaeon HR04]
MSVPVTPYIDFEVLNEPWNVYELSDGSRLRTRLVLLNVLNTGQYDDLGKPIYQTANTTLFVVRAPKELKGPPTIPLPDPSELLDYAIDVSISRHVVDAWNIYSLENGAKLKMKLIITSIKRSSKYDPFGEPIYVISSQPVIDLDVPKTLLRKIK